MLVEREHRNPKYHDKLSENAKQLFLLRHLKLLQSSNNNLNHFYDHHNYLQQYFLLEGKLNLIQGQSI